MARPSPPPPPLNGPAIKRRTFLCGFPYFMVKVIYTYVPEGDNYNICVCIGKLTQLKVIICEIEIVYSPFHKILPRSGL